jgi:hypothetical protein
MIGMGAPYRALVTLPKGIWAIIKNDLKGRIGDSDSEVIRNIVISYLTEKGYFEAENVMQSKDEEDVEIGTEKRLDFNEAMVLAIAEILIDKDIITGESWTEKTNKKYAEIRNRK